MGEELQKPKKKKLSKKQKGWIIAGSVIGSIAIIILMVSYRKGNNR